MFAFLFLAIPSILVCYCLTDNHFDSKKSFIPPILFGFLTGIFYITIREFFVSGTSTQVASFWKSSLKFFLCKDFFPTLIVTAIFMIFSKDSLDYKISSLIPLISSFYAVFIPYDVIALEEKHTFYMLFTRTIIAISSIFSFSALIRFASEKFKNKNINSGILFSILSLFLFFIPSVSYSIWYYKISTVLLIIISVLMICSAAFLTVLVRIKNLKNKEAAYRPVFLDM